MFELMDSYSQNAVIKVLGVGGGGGNAVQHMVEADIEGVEFICANTDAQALKKSDVKKVLQLGANLTKGLGAGGDPEVGRKAAEEDKDQIAEVIDGSDMLFITAGMGGGTGTGAAPVVAEIAREKGILTVAVVTRPFPFEGPKRTELAENGIQALAANVDSLIIIPNEKLLLELGPDTALVEAFAKANDVLLSSVQGISDLIIRPGLINVDFADVRTVMSERGQAMMGSGSATGQGRAAEAAEQAIHCPLLEDVDLAGAGGVLVNITAGPGLTVSEFEDVGNRVREFASDEAIIVVGTAIDEEMGDRMRVTVVITGLGDLPQAQGATPAPTAGGDRHSNGSRSGSRVVKPATTARSTAPVDDGASPSADAGEGETRSPAAERMRLVKPWSIDDLLGSHESVGQKEDLEIPTYLRRRAD